MPPVEKKDEFGNYVAELGGGFRTASAIPVSSLRAEIKPIDLPQVVQTPAPDTTRAQAVIDEQMKATSKPFEVPKEGAPKEPSAIESFLKSMKKPESQAGAYETAYDTTGIASKEQDILEKQKVVKTAQGKLASINAELKAISAESEKQQLQLEGQGRGQTMDFLNRQSSEIRRQAAIKALPLQAQALVAQAEVQSAQGDVELAQNSMKMASDRLTTLFNLHVKDAEAEFNYNKDLRDKVYEFATAKEKAKLDKLNKEDERNFQMMRDNVNNAQAIAKTALEAGQADIAARITQLDPKSKTYKEDLARLQSQIRVPQKEVTLGKDGKTATSGELKLATIKAKVDQLSAIANEGGIGSSVGTSFMTRSPSGFWGNVGAVASIVGIPSTLKGAYSKLTGAQQNFIGDIEQLRSELNLDTLINAKAQGATFGALSDNELRMLASAATKIGTWTVKNSDGEVVGYNTSEANFKKEIDKINNFAKLDYIVKGGDPMDVNAVIQSDGSIWSKNSDGTLTQIK